MMINQAKARQCKGKVGRVKVRVRVGVRTEGKKSKGKKSKGKMSKDEKGVCRRVKVKSKDKRSKGNKNKAINVWSDIGM